MLVLPEKIRRALERTVKELRTKENVYGVGLFGSWSRSDAASSSDVDLLVLDASNFDLEYVERTEVNGLLIDLDHVPKKWIHGQIPPDLDQKMYELQILYDRDWSLTNTKLQMAKSYSSPERVDIRTEAHVVDSDIYLSRATSAFSREDFGAAWLFAAIALRSSLKIVAEIALRPLSTSRLIEIFEGSTIKLGLREAFEEYLRLASLDQVDEAGVREKLKLFRAIWDELHVVAEHNSSVLQSSHFKVRTLLTYYLNSLFLQGTVMRAGSLIDNLKVVEACHYLKSILVEVVENYVWLKSSIDRVKVDYTTLIRSLESLEEKNPKNCERIVEFLDLGGADEMAASEAIDGARDMIVRIRRDRKVLIKNHLLRA